MFHSPPNSPEAEFAGKEDKVNRPELKDSWAVRILNV